MIVGTPGPGSGLGRIRTERTTGPVVAVSGTSRSATIFPAASAFSVLDEIGAPATGSRVGMTSRVTS